MVADRLVACVERTVQPMKDDLEAYRKNAA